MGLGALAAEFEQAAPFPVPIVAVVQGKSSRIKMGASLAVFMDQAAVGKFGAPRRIQSGSLL